MSLRALKYFFILLGLLYLLSPWDLIPDFMGLFSRLDDLAVLALLYWRYQLKVRDYLAKIKFYQEKLKGEATTSSDNNGHTAQLAPHQILEIESEASPDEVEKAYKRLTALYHPDKVNHLGKDLKELAHRKTLQIQDAYEKLKKGHP